ncbi:MAG TPA: PEGA domain-containing protein [Candidatus Dojkabacteria bacterium]|nr:PEGA domain-containing protein [Candidatus Dojkabacteria bacterium]
MHKKNKELLHKIFDIVSIIIIPILIITGTIAVVLYSKGYRLSFKDSSVKQTGVLSVDSDPTQADISLMDKIIGKTAKTVGSLEEGKYSVSLLKDGYHPWVKQVEIMPSKSTFVHSYMIKNDIEGQLLTTIEGQLIDTLLSQNEDHLFFISSKTFDKEKDVSTISKVRPQSILNPSIDMTYDTNSTEIVTLQEYRFNRAFWDISENPKTILNIPTTQFYSTEALPTENGEYILFTLTNYSQDISNITNPDEMKTYITDKRSFIATTNDNTAQLIEVQLDSYYENYSITWADDNKNIILSNKSEVLSFNFNTGATTVLLKNPSIWTTDTYGNFYYLTKEKRTIIDQYRQDANTIENINTIQNNTTASSQEELDETEKTILSPVMVEKEYYKISQKKLNGTEEKVFIDEIYFNNNPEYLRQISTLLQSNNDNNKLASFSNSPYSTLFCGDIIGFKPNDTGRGTIIQTTHALYWYDGINKKYSIITTDPSTFISYSPDDTMILYKSVIPLDISSEDSMNQNDANEIADIENEFALYTFTFYKEETDNYTRLGKKILLNSTEDSPISDIKWLPNSKYVLYEQDYNINLIDYEGDNQNMLLSKNQLIHKSIDENNTEDPAENEESRLENTDSDPSINDEEADINDIINKYFITNFSSDKSYHIEVTDQNISIMEYEIN